MFGLGLPEMLILALIAFLLFGHRLPGMMRGAGQAITEFKKGLAGVDKDDNE